MSFDDRPKTRFGTDEYGHRHAKLILGIQGLHAGCLTFQEKTCKSGPMPNAYRFAPSPNGELHLGHAYSALLNAKLAKESGGRFLVRIEDIDTARCTAELASRALGDLAWLGLAWEQPVRVQSRHLADYAEVQQRLFRMGLLYPCFCSRADIARMAAGADPEGQPLYPGTCRTILREEASRRIAAGMSCSWRIDNALACRYAGASDALTWGDVILARKDIATSYHVAVVTDDALQGITHVVRGRDLLQATSIHRLLQKLLGMPHPDYHHHDLIPDAMGRKLSKSEGAKSLRHLREEGISAKEIRHAMGFP